MKNSFHRIATLAHNTLTESLRQKTLGFLFLFAVLAIAASNFLTQFTVDEQLKFLKDFCLGAIAFFGTLIAILGTAFLLPSEMEHRTLYTILSKPVRRWEFLLGKFCGMALLLLIATSLMSLLVIGMLFYKEQILIAGELQDSGGMITEVIARRLAEISAQARDPRLLQAITLLYAKSLLIAAITLLIYTISTSLIFTVSSSLLVYLAGHLISTAREAWLAPGVHTPWMQKIFLGIISILIPDLGAYSLVDDVAAGTFIPWSYTLDLLCYTGAYLLVLLTLSHLIFSNREL